VSGRVPEEALRPRYFSKPKPVARSDANQGIGEHSLIATAPSILNAIRDAIGVAIRTVPATPDRVLAAIRSAQRFDDVPGDQR
jgi:CO/xanthine dehydrogenase Mo-binding subunit